MNRQTILAVIHRQLRESLAETGEIRPLGEIVGSVADEIRGERNGQTAPTVIPIETVAAFVDGSLSDEEVEAVCRAIMVDNSVLAELVSAVRSIQQPAESLAPLSGVLRSQLLAMQSSLPVSPGSSPSTPPPMTTDSEDDLPIAEETFPVSVQDTSVATPVAAESAAESAATRPADGQTVPRPAPTIKTDSVVVHSSDRVKRRKTRHQVIALLAVAASLLALIVLVTTRDDDPPEQPKIVQEDSKPSAPALIVPESISPAPDNDSNTQVVDAMQPEPVQRNEPPVEPTPDTDPPARVAQQDPVNVAPQPPIPTDTPAIPEPRPAPTPPPASLAGVTEMSGLRWTKVTGVATQADQVVATSQAQTTQWRSIQPGSALERASGEGALTLRTLPLSRAEASLQSGGRVVLAADSGVEVSRPDSTVSAEIKLHYGDMALVDLPQGTLIRLIKAGRELAMLHWESKASAVLQHGADGLQVHVRHGTIDINDQPHKDASVSISRDRRLQAIEQPKREPAWVDRPVESINIKQSYLAQIGESQNVMGTLSQQIRELAQDRRVTDADAKTLATLAGWQAALAGENVFRLAGSQIPAVRMAALSRILTLPRWDPRYQRLWTAIDNGVRDRQRAARFRRLVLMAQQNGAPTAAQLNSMLTDLAAPDIASRAMSDYLLRRFHRNAARRLPTYDPTWTGQTQTRAVNQWRAYLGRTGNGATLQPAAAAGRVR